MKQGLNAIKRYFSTQKAKPKICIVGSGPAGFYAAQQFAKQVPASEIDIYERLPVPFGLVRFGVAPDHPEVKNVINTFTKTAQSPNVRYIGNVQLGKDVSLKQLQEAYNVVLLTYGAEENRSLGIPGENLRNVFPARKIVGWYNGIPWDKDLQLDLSGRSVAIFGQGNVAIDVARILLTPVDQLKKTDITQHALEALAKSNVKEVHLIGRRGPLQAAFTIKELREMLKLDGCSTVWKKNDFEGISEIIPNLKRPKKRIAELMLKSALETNSSHPKKFFPTFLRSPLEIIGDERVEKVKLRTNVLSGADILNQQAIGTEAFEFLDCDMAVTSIGYKSLQADEDIPFNTNAGIAENEYGKIAENLHTAGWLATGPTGVILTTMSNAFETAEAICKDLDSAPHKAGFGEISKVLRKQNVQVVTWAGWGKIDQYEKEAGAKVGKPREKLLDVQKMLEIAA